MRVELNFSLNKYVNKLISKTSNYSIKKKDTEQNHDHMLLHYVFGAVYAVVLTHLLPTQAHLPEIKVHAYFAPVTPPPSVHGGGQRLCRCCIILWQWRARGGHLCLQVLLLWYGLKRGGRGRGAWVGAGERRGWTHSLLLITDHYMDRSLLIPDQLNPPLLSPLAHQSVLQQPRVWAWRGGWKEHRWMDFFSLCLILFFSL